ncbi:MAG: hypothetical protein IK125_05835 [Lachnospiraceae bacterium]|nr:hypothetical protein [Lachnospiraceae bacterium]
MQEDLNLEDVAGKGKNDEVIMCAANSYTQKYFLDPRFSHMPDNIKDDIKILSVAFTEECGGIFLMSFDEEGNLNLSSYSDANDYLYDEISAGLYINRYRMENRELFAALETFYKIVFLDMGLDEV